ncbi:MAG: hypothetical protein WC975_04630 [Phycisphaerae bacterium]
MSGEMARKLRLHPAPTEEPVEKNKPHGRSEGDWKILAFVLAVGAGLGILSHVYFSFMRYYRAEGRIVIKGISQEVYPSAVRKHLVGMLSCNLPIGTDEQTSIQKLIRQGQLSIFPSDKQTISLLVSGSDRESTRKLVEDIALSYVAYMNENQGPQSPEILKEYKELQLQHGRMRLQISNLTQDLPHEKIDQVLNTVSRRIQDRGTEADGLISRLDKVNKDISALRDQLAHPTLKLDPQRWNQIRHSDRMYSGDLNALRGKHADYMSNLESDMKELTSSLNQLHNLLKTISAKISQQLQIQLPEDLSDDLLEMNLAVEKYDGQVVRFGERWERYQAKLVELLSSPAEADFDGIGTLLSQLRQDLLQRCSRLPTRMEGLFNQLRQGSGQPGKLSGLTARNVASSGISGDLGQVLDTWRKITFHLNRLFPDGNVNLLTLGRVCRSLQWRLNFREKQLRQMIEEQQLAIQKRETQNNLVLLQKEFEQTSGKLIELYRQFSGDQRQWVDISKRWPALQRTQESIRKNEIQMAQIEKELGEENVSLGHERLETRPAIVRAYSYAGIDPKWEILWMILPVIIGLGVTGVLRPEVFRVIFLF